MNALRAFAVALVGFAVGVFPVTLSPYGKLSPIDRVIILGVSYTGKTTHARELVSESRRVVFFDPAADYIDDAAEVVTADELELYADDLLSGPWVRVAVVSDSDERDVADDFEKATRIVRRAGNLVYVADEVGDYSAEAERVLTRLARNGRHDGIASVLVSQAATDIPKTCRRQATRIVSLLQTEPDDLAALAKRCGDDFAARVAAWRPGAPPVTWTLPTLQHRST